MTTRFLVLFDILSVFWLPANAQPISRPEIAVEMSVPNQREHQHTPWKRFTATADLPIPYALLGGLFALKGQYILQERLRGGSEGMRQETKTFGVSAMGITYLPHAKEGHPPFFLSLQNWGMFEQADSTMQEWTVGRTLAKADSPWNLCFHPTDKTNSRLELRFRQFRGFQRWLPVVGHRIERKNGFFVELDLPVEGRIGWQSVDRGSAIFTSVEIRPEAFPGILDQQDGWYEGYQEMAVLGVRQSFFGWLQSRAEVGVMRERLSFYDENGKSFYRHWTESMPHMRILLEGAQSI